MLVGRRRGVRGGERFRRRWVCRCVVGVAAALSGREGSGGRGPTGKGSDNQHVVGGCVWQGAGVGGARRSSWPPSETTSLAPEEAPRRCSSQGWRLSCGGEEEDASTKATTMAAGMSSSWRLQEQALDGAMRAGGGRRGRGDNGGGGRVVDDMTRGGGGRREASSLVRSRQRQWVGSSPAPRRRGEGDGRGDAAVPSDPRRNRLRRRGRRTMPQEGRGGRQRQATRAIVGRCKATMMAATTAVGMSSRRRLQLRERAGGGGGRGEGGRRAQTTIN